MNESKKTANALRDALEQKPQFEHFLERRDGSTVELEYVIQIQDENKGRMSELLSAMEKFGQVLANIRSVDDIVRVLGVKL